MAQSVRLFREMGHDENEMDIATLNDQENRIALNSRYLRGIAQVAGRGKIAVAITSPTRTAALPPDEDGYCQVVIPGYAQQ